MRTRQFEIPKEIISQFFDQAQNESLTVNLVEVDQENEELIVEVEYEEDERESVMNLIELIDDYYEENAEEEDE